MKKQIPFINTQPFNSGLYGSQASVNLVYIFNEFGLSNKETGLTETTNHVLISKFMS